MVTSREWALIGGDPAPGNTGLIASRTSELKRTVTALDDAKRELGRIRNGVADTAWQGESASAMRDAIEDVSGNLGLVRTSFDEVARALDTYRTTLGELQTEARRAVAKAKVARSRQAKADAALDAARQRLQAQQNELTTLDTTRRSVLYGPIPTDPIADAQRTSELDRLDASYNRLSVATSRSRNEITSGENESTNAKADLARQKRVRDEIRERWKTASKRAQNSVEHALQHQLRNPSNLERLANAVAGGIAAIERFLENPLPYIASLREVIKEISGVLSWISAVSGLIGPLLVLVPIPVVSAIGAGLVVLSRVTSLVVLALDVLVLAATVALVYSHYKVDGKPAFTWGDIGSDALSAGLGAVGARKTFGKLKSAGVDKGLRSMINATRGTEFKSLTEVAKPKPGAPTTKSAMSATKDFLISEFGPKKIAKDTAKSMGKGYTKSLIDGSDKLDFDIENPVAPLVPPWMESGAPMPLKNVPVRLGVEHNLSIGGSAGPGPASAPFIHDDMKVTSATIGKSARDD